LSILGKCFHIPLLFENGKKKHNTLTPYIKIVLSAALLRFNYCSPFAIYVIQMNCLDRRGFRFSWRYVDGKAGYTTFKVKDAVTKKEITINNSHF
jgi:hypothetical protein